MGKTLYDFQKLGLDNKFVDGHLYLVYMICYTLVLL